MTMRDLPDLSGPQLRYSRVLEESQPAPLDPQEALVRALELARKVEELLEDTRSVPGTVEPHSAVHSTRMARAMAASLVDELEALSKPASSPARKSGVA